MRGLLIFVLAGALFLASCPKPGGRAAGGSGWASPDFTYAHYDGAQEKISSHVGRPLVVNFWAVW